ncbi:glycosyltransferase family 4 protein [Mesorhizobium sp. M0768]|uniref:glycosyltransferase family 4 protein n=1 Tax=Mesorhizobium sp. M0768 TaxID=2956996 RepID=UPI003337F792
MLVGPSCSPVTGQSAMFQAAVDVFPGARVVRIKGTDRRAIIRCLFAAEFLWKYFRNLYRKEVELVYVTVSRSVSGFIRDFIVYLSARSAAKRIVFHCHGGDLHNLFNKRIFGRIASFIYRRADAIIFLNRCSIPAEIVSLKNIWIVDNCYQGFKETAPTQAPEKKWKRPGRRVTYIGNFIRQKGVDDVLDVISKINEKNSSTEISFVLAGKFLNEPDLEAEVRRRAAGMSNLRLIAGPQRSQLELELKDSNFLIFPSRYPSECQPLVVIEALVAGAIPMITDVNGIQEQFSEFSFLKITPRDSDGMVEVLLANLSVDLSDVATANRDLATVRFSEDKFKESLATVLASYLRN